MNKSKRVLECVAVLSLTALVGCSAQPKPSAGAPTATATSAMPVLTSTGVASAEPPPAPAPASSAPAPATSGSAMPPAATMCGGFAGFRCPEKQFCSYPVSAKCGAGDLHGTCQPIPELCTMEFAPVCGCDDHTYSTSCAANRSGTSVAKAGACAGAGGSIIAEGKVCGTRGVQGACAEGSYCAYRSQCGAPDTAGICAKKPEVCTREFVPVCGCDNRTYPNKCEAARAGVSVAASGECKAK